jgi:hypothetical protein
MRWWRELLSAIGLLGLVQPGCGGRSRADAEQPASGTSGSGGSAGRAQPGGSGRGGDTAGRENGAGGRSVGTSGAGSGPLAGAGGRALGGAGGAASGGRGVVIAGEGGEGGEGGRSCEDTLENAMDFCHGPSALDCPLSLDDARRLDLYCEWDGENLVYAACDDLVSISYTVGGEEDYEFIFDRESGALVYGKAYVYDNECGGVRYYTGEPPELVNCTVCEYCAEAGFAGSGSEDPRSVGRCKFDEDDRVLTPEPCNECTEEACLVEPAEFCPSDIPFECPFALDEVRQADALCTASQGVDSITYGVCEDGTAFVRWESLETWTTLGFALDSGALVLGEVLRWSDATAYCDPLAETVTERRLDESLCTTCSLRDYCLGSDQATGEAGAGSDDCVVDEQGGVALPQ